MLYLLAVVGALTVAVLLWRAFGMRSETGVSAPRRTVAPDDDPDFLRRLDDEKRKRPDEDPPA
ncbi:hypothetical protein EV193_101415 [Herbihabitans rhizosphaerae]|uniref:Uncharacterized protein n=1 Tax=Herbihabitans rhizosphaerae TaxID=1872711 RepID=A0A4Q7L4I2_9PSEU|nr:hypothetical protein [Herbihabitans rhizosphaerae]RZS44539.1 hypothetical protein EV193_101415 [Herbihabitans rhizosphaerae]